MRPLLLFTLLAYPIISGAAITVTGVVDKTKYDTSVTFTVTADPAAAVTTATLDGAPATVGSAVNVRAVSYHELKVESRSAVGALVDSELIRFIVRNPARNGSEDGIPSFTPLRMVNDAPSAFAGGTLKIVAPASWPVGLPIPIAAILRDSADEGLRLNGRVSFGGIPQAALQLRRGWGSLVAPAATSAGTLELDAAVNGLTADRDIQIQANPVFTPLTGTVSADLGFPANSRIHVTGTVTINAGVTVTFGPGTIVKISTGTATNGSAAEFVVNGTLQCNGTEANPVAFVPDTAGEQWGGIELPVATSAVNATYTIFTGSGEDESWFTSHSGYSTHKQEQALFLIAGSGSGTAVGAQIHLTDCYCFSLAGQEMNSRTNTWIDLKRTLMQRAITCGELNGSKVTIDRSALIEFPSEDAQFVDGDNDGIYLTNGDLSITNTVIGFNKDDGVDSGGNGGDNPYTAAADVTPYVSMKNWYEGSYHEGNSLSGTRNVFFTGCVFMNCGQGIESGYSASGTGDGPNAFVDQCLFVSNMVGTRWGDNYGSGYGYNETMEVKNSILLNSYYRDAFSGNWHPTNANGWIYQDGTATNSLGRKYFDVHDNYLSQPDPLHHPSNVAWNPTTHGALLAPYMPVPGSNVGVAITRYGPTQDGISAYPGVFTVRLSTFSSRQVTVDWAVLGKTEPFADNEQTLLSGSLTFAPGETNKSIAAAFPSPANFSVIHVALRNAVNAEVTGEAWFFRPPTNADPTLIAAGSTAWRYREARSEPPAAWKQLGFDDSSAAATDWRACTLPAGFGGSVTLGTTVASGSSTDRTKAFYFRKKFNVPDLTKISSLTLRILRDDAAVVWLNNPSAPTLVSADGTFNSPYTYDATTIATGNVPSASEPHQYLTAAIPVSALVAGENILAVQVHQTSLTSGDLLFDCELIATYEPPLELHLSRSGQSPFLWWFGTSDLLEESTDLKTWIPVRGGLSPFPLQPIGSNRFFRLRR